MSLTSEDCNLSHLGEAWVTLKERECLFLSLIPFSTDSRIIAVSCDIFDCEAPDIVDVSDSILVQE